jgi:hypothetical protein
MTLSHAPVKSPGSIRHYGIEIDSRAVLIDRLDIRRLEATSFSAKILSSDPGFKSK